MIYIEKGMTYVEGVGEWDVPVKAVETYKILLAIEMKNRGASESDIAMVKDATICNAIRRGISVEDTAWAILS